MLEAFVPLSPAQVWGLFVRGLGLIFLISFASLADQIVRGAGERGGMPIGRRLAKIEEDFPTWRRFFYFPTLLWVSRSDAMLRVLVWAGIAASCWVIYGGPLSPYALLACYVCYLSLDMAIGLIFPWDCVLFEAVLLSLFLPPIHALPEISAVAAPAPALAWAYRLLIFRLMFGFGKQKFLGATKKDRAYLKGFLVAQPLPSPLGWYAQKLPVWALTPMVWAMFLVEIPIAFCALVPGDLSILCAVATAGLMIGIQVMGSFGYFSVLTIAGCIPLLDQETARAFTFGGMFESIGSFDSHFGGNLFVLIHTIGCLFVLPFNSWVGQSWHLWSSWFRLKPIYQLPFSFFRALHPFRWLHPYGVFPPNTYPGVKVSLLVEVTWDQQTWHEVDFNYSPSNTASAPKFVSPYHPRGDQAVIYETFGLNPTSLISGMVGPWDPYSYGTQPAANVLVQCIVEGRGTDFMAPGSVLSQRKEPPVAARITTVMLVPCTLEERKRTGHWWKRTYVGPHTPPRGHDPLFWDELLPDPELWHFEAIFWRSRSRFHRVMQKARAGSVDSMQLVLEDSPMTARDVELFWNELVPMVQTHDLANLDALPDAVDAFRARYDRGEQRRLMRLNGRFAALLVARMEPHYLAKGFSPPLPAKTYLHVWMLALKVMSEGKDAYLAAFENPMSLAEQAASFEINHGLFMLGVFRFEALVFEAQKLRLITAIMPPHDEALKASMDRGEKMTPMERKIADFAEAFAGFFSVMRAFRFTFLGPRCNHGFPEKYPSFEQLETGEVILREPKNES
jgi:hypothetical protein